jgi:glycosyltransferase involved in cell wall biosynthesis
MLQRLLLFSKSDITVWAPKFESFGIIGLNSICMGTPVLSWDIKPQNEYLQPWKNAVLVPCVTRDNWLGVPQVENGCYSDFGDCLISLLRDRELLAKIKSSVLTGMDSRRKQFMAGWAELLK